MQTQWLPVTATPTPVPTAPASATAASAPAFVASQYAAVHTTEMLTAQSLLMLGRRTTTPQSSAHSSVEQWLQCTEQMPASPLQANSVPSRTAYYFASRCGSCYPSAASVARFALYSTHAMQWYLVGGRRVSQFHSRNVWSHVWHDNPNSKSGQIQYEQSQNQTNQILAQAEMQMVSAEIREEAQRTDALKREEMLIQMKMNTDQVNADWEKCQIEANQKMRADTEAANQKREQALLKLKMDSDETTRKREHLFWKKS